MYIAVMLVFAAAGGVLWVVGRSDRRALLLGLVFAVGAAPFSDRILALRAAAASSPAAFDLLRHLQVEAFGPLLLWLFASEFPRVASPNGTRLSRTAVQVATLLGCALFAANLLPLVLRDPAAAVFAVVGRTQRGSLYWPIVFGLSVPALAYSIWRSRRAEPDERRRVQLLLLGHAVGLAPVMTLTILAAIPRFGRIILQPEVVRGLGYWLVYPAILSVPVTTAWAVLVDRALDVRLVVRKALQYALARYTMVGAATLPFLVLGGLLYTRRDTSLAQLTRGPTGIALATVAALAFTGLRTRRHMLDALDRRFFREQYDTKHILANLVANARSLAGPAELGAVLEWEIERALHLGAAHFLVRDAQRAEFVSPTDTIRPLPGSAATVARLEAGGGAFEIDFGRPSAWLRGLDPGEQEWLVDAGARLLLPIQGETGGLRAFLVLGEKRSELPFTGEDRLLLAAIADSAALALARAGPGSTDAAESDREAGQQPTRECPACGLISSGPERCERCAATTEQAGIPLLLRGKFRMIERIGRGGMGVVYRSTDLALGRDVAIKTLPVMGPREASRLRREARAMALTSHPNLATIYGAESWRGLPMLVCEYLAGGTLAHRLERGPLAIPDTLRIGLSLAPALERLHSMGILHGDIKPSNIGFTADGTPKLLDFGLARALQLALATGDSGPAFPAHPASPDSALRGSTRSGMGGTLAYLSPEVVRGEPPGPPNDLWAFVLSLYEAIAGVNPFSGKAAPLTLLEIASASIPDLRDMQRDASEAVAGFFRDALSPDAGRRPGSATALGQRLGSLLSST